MARRSGRDREHRQYLGEKRLREICIEHQHRLTRHVEREFNRGKYDQLPIGRKLDSLGIVSYAAAFLM